MTDTPQPGEILRRIQATIPGWSATDRSVLQVVLDEEGPEALIEAVLDAAGFVPSEDTPPTDATWTRHEWGGHSGPCVDDPACTVTYDVGEDVPVGLTPDPNDGTQLMVEIVTAQNNRAHAEATLTKARELALQLDSRYHLPPEWRPLVDLLCDGAGAEKENER